MDSNVMKNRIEKTAMTLFTKYGIKSVTIDDITTALSMSKKTFYKYFDGKETLLTQLIDNSISGFKQNVQVLKLKYRGLDQFLWISYYHLHWMRSCSRGMAFEIKKYHPEIADKYNSFRSRFISTNMVELIHEAKLQGLVRSEVDETLFCKVQLNLIEGVVHDQYQFLADLDQSSLFDHLILNNLKGILTSSYGTHFTLENFRLDLKEAS